MIYEVEEGKTYLSPSRKPFKVLHVGKHGQNCSCPMIVYTNLEETDLPPGQIWVIEESLFLKLFTEQEEGH